MSPDLLIVFTALMVMLFAGASSGGRRRETEGRYNNNNYNPRPQTTISYISPSEKYTEEHFKYKYQFRYFIAIGKLAVLVVVFIVLFLGMASIPKEETGRRQDNYTPMKTKVTIDTSKIEVEELSLEDYVDAGVF